MTKPATEARLAAAAKGFTQVVSRGNAHIITKNPTTGKCAYDGQVGGGWHYNGDQETDTAWQTGTAPWNYQMVKAGYNLFALSNLANGQVIKWLDPGSGESVTFQPMGLIWTNALNQIQQISMPQSVAAQVSDDVLYWPAGYGAGRHFKYVASPSRLNKLLIIDSAASLPATSYDTLELNFIMDMSSGVTAYIDSGSGLAAWNKKTQRDTVKAIEFRLSNGTVVWSFAVPTAYDSSGNPETEFTTGIMRLKKQGSSLYVSVRFPKAWINTAQFPITIDPTVNYQVGAGGDDGSWYWLSSSWYFQVTGEGNEFAGYYDSHPANAFIRFTGVTIPAGATIDASYISVSYVGKSGTPLECTIYGTDEADPAAISSGTDGNTRARTTASVAWTPPSGGTWNNTGSLNTICQELVDSNSYAAGSHMQFVIIGPSSAGGNAFGQWCSYEGYSGGVLAEKLHIEYTEAAAGGSLVIPPRSRRFNALLVR